MVESSMINPQNTPVQFTNPAQRIEKSFSEASIGAKRNIAGDAESKADTFTGSVARYGGDALKSGAAQQGYADIFAGMNADISNMILNYTLQKDKMILGAEQYLQGLTAKGVLDHKTGDFLRSTFDMELEMEDVRFQNSMEQLNKRGDISNTNAMWQGLGTLGSLGIMAMNPFAGLMSAGANGAGKIGENTGGFPVGTGGMA